MVLFQVLAGVIAFVSMSSALAQLPPVHTLPLPPDQVDNHSQGTRK